MELLAKLKRFRLRAFGHSLDPERQVDNTDAFAAVSSGPDRLDPQGGTGHGGAPPGYVKTDDGRPRH
jgi:hypothetical protein